MAEIYNVFDESEAVRKFFDREGDLFIVHDGRDFLKGNVSDFRPVLQRVQREFPRVWSLLTTSHGVFGGNRFEDDCALRP